MRKIITYTLTIILWIVLIILAFKGMVYPIIALLVLHFAELLFAGLSIGREFGCSVLRCVVMCMLFGFLWWLPIKRIIAEDTLSDDDFIDDGMEPWREIQ